ncbi:MAG: transporter [Bacteroidales bacterium]|nr:transporter [Bacteroidales bacterium]
MFRILKNWMLPIAMLTGAVFHRLFEHLSFLTPYLIFSMLLLTFCKLSLKNIRFIPLHGWLLLIQTFGSILVYALFCFFNPVLAESALICVLAPTATAAAVITGMLGGNIAFLATYVLVSNLGTAIAAPIIFSLLGSHSDMPFMQSFLYICKQVFPLLILPLLCAWGMQKFTPKLHMRLLGIHQLSFYLWAIALTIVMGKTVVFLVDQQNPNYTNEILIALLSLVICVLQFFIGRRLGKHYGDAISAGQGLGQKNTILAIWMAQIYLSPLASIGPAAYVVWQNSINSYQLWKKRKTDQ